ncbi:MAG TPA: DUF3300 domain-containing protein [Ottowia sp.]|nr:DUF3300 domain-containing protein [Ottowia sp.]
MLLPVHGQAQTAARPFSNEQLEQMTAPVALFPDALLAQLFMATTYPDDFAAAAAWSKSHPNDKGDAAVKMVENQPWDPSVTSLVAFPDVLITFGAQPEWVRNMGDAFLAQPDDVMNAVQRLRQRAQQAGNLKSNEQITVSTQKPEPAPATVVVQQSAPPPQVIVIEPAQPSVVFVPAYNPMYVFGPWPYPAYAPFFFPPPPGYWFSRTIATGIAWGIGIGVSNALWGGCNWGRGSVNINVNRYNNINVNRPINANVNRSNWNHNPELRGATPYRGGDATRQNLDRQYQAGSREQFRGKDATRDPSRDASRERASQAMQSRGIDPGNGSARDRAQSVDRGAVQQGMQNADRGGAQQRAQTPSRDNALAGANDRQARQQMDRGAASQQSAQRNNPPASRPAPAPAGGGRMGGGGGGGGGARVGGAGGGGGGRAGGGGRGR